MYLKILGAISTESDESLKLEDQFICFGSHISSTESDVDIYLIKAWNALNRLSITGWNDKIVALEKTT